MNEPDVLVIGSGPVGLTLALACARHGLRVTIVERDVRPRIHIQAVALDDESLRIWQACGLEDMLAEDWDGGANDQVIARYRNPRGRAFLTLTQHESDLGYPHAVAINQARIVRKLLAAVDANPSIELRVGHKVTNIRQDRSHVTIVGTNSDGAPFELRGAWAVGCDGASSNVRNALDIDMTRRELPHPWLVANVVDRDVQDHAIINCDPGRSWMTLSLPHGVRRIECMLDVNDDGAWLQDESKVRQRLAQAWPAINSSIILEQTIRRFSAGSAEHWRCGRVFLAGDAAHTTPPFAGQGLACGLRDASNLAFKLAGVCQRWLPESVLDTYESERRPHLERMLNLALRLGDIMMPRGRVQATCAQLALHLVTQFTPVRRRLEMRGRGIRPVYRNGFMHNGRKAGHYLPQPWVRSDRSERMRLDALLGPRMTWVAIGDGRKRGTLGNIDVRPGDSVLIENRDFVDPERLLQNTLGPARCALVRPDRIIHTHCTPGRHRPRMRDASCIHSI